MSAKRHYATHLKGKCRASCAMGEYLIVDRAWHLDKSLPRQLPSIIGLIRPRDCRRMSSSVSQGQFRPQPLKAPPAACTQWRPLAQWHQQLAETVAHGSVIVLERWDSRFSLS